MASRQARSFHARKVIERQIARRPARDKAARGWSGPRQVFRSDNIGGSGLDHLIKRHVFPRSRVKWQSCAAWTQRPISRHWATFGSTTAPLSPGRAQRFGAAPARDTPPMPLPDLHLRIRRLQDGRRPQPMTTGGPGALISGDRRGIAFALAEAWFDLAPLLAITSAERVRRPCFEESSCSAGAQGLPPMGSAETPGRLVHKRGMNATCRPATRRRGDAADGSARPRSRDHSGFPDGQWPGHSRGRIRAHAIGNRRADGKPGHTGPKKLRRL